MIKRIGIHSAPRSGSSWLGGIFSSHPKVAYKFQPLYSYEFKNAISVHSDELEIRQFFSNLLNSQSEFVNQLSFGISGSVKESDEENSKFLVYKEVRYHHLLKNLLEKDPEFIAIGLVRNPVMVLQSWWKAPKEFRADLGWDFLEEWKFAEKKNERKEEEYNGFTKWKELTLLFESLKEAYPKRFILVEYNELIKDTEGQIKLLFEKLGMDYPEETTQFINRKVQDANPYSINKLKISDHRIDDKFPVEVVSAIEVDLKGTSLEKYLYK